MKKECQLKPESHEQTVHSRDVETSRHSSDPLMKHNSCVLQEPRTPPRDGHLYALIGGNSLYVSEMWSLLKELLKCHLCILGENGDAWDMKGSVTFCERCTKVMEIRLCWKPGGEAEDSRKVFYSENHHNIPVLPRAIKL